MYMQRLIMSEEKKDSTSPFSELHQMRFMTGYEDLAAMDSDLDTDENVPSSLRMSYDLIESPPQLFPADVLHPMYVLLISVFDDVSLHRR